MRRQVVRGRDPRRTSVVLVDDNADIRWVTRLALERNGFQVVGEAGDGAAGVDVVRACDPDLVLLDLSMPGLGGVGALERLREECPATRVVVFTCSLRQPDIDAALALGAVGVIRKGTSLTQVIAEARTLLGVRPARHGQHALDHVV